MPNSNNMSSEVVLGSWRFCFDGGNTIDVECTTWDPESDWQRTGVPAPMFFKHSDLEMFARGWVACRNYV